MIFFLYRFIVRSHNSSSFLLGEFSGEFKEFRSVESSVELSVGDGSARSGEMPSAATSLGALLGALLGTCCALFGHPEAPEASGPPLGSVFD